MNAKEIVYRFSVLSYKNKKEILRKFPDIIYKPIYDIEFLLDEIEKLGLEEAFIEALKEVSETPKVVDKDMTRDEAIKAFQAELKEDDLISKKTTLDDIIETLGIRDERFLLPAEEVLYNVVKNEPYVTPTQRPWKWIPVSERLPENGTHALVVRFDYVTNGQFIDLLWYDNGTWWNRQFVGDFAVTHWIPLPPEPPKEAEE